MSRSLRPQTRARFSKPRVVFRGLFCAIEHRLARYPDGATKVFERIRRIPSVAVIPIDARGRVLLIREFREASGHWRLTVPGGRVDRERSPKQAAQRELREEAGVRARSLRLLSKSTSRGYLYWPWYVYVARDLVHDPLPQDQGEEITLVPTSLARAYRLALNGDIELTNVALAIIRLWHEKNAKRKTKKVKGSAKSKSFWF